MAVLIIILSIDVYNNSTSDNSTSDNSDINKTEFSMYAIVFGLDSDIHKDGINLLELLNFTSQLDCHSQYAQSLSSRGEPAKLSHMYLMCPPYAEEKLAEYSLNHSFSLHQVTEFDNITGTLLDHWSSPRKIDHSVHCGEICSDEIVTRQGAEIFISPYAQLSYTQNPIIPREITIVLGVNNTVHWHNLDTTAHTLVASYGGWDTGRMLPWETASVTFNQTGVYDYHGIPGPWITGTIIVIDEQSFERSGHDPLGTTKDEFQIVGDTPIIERYDILIFFATQLMNLGIDWEVPNVAWISDFRVQLPARICSQITVYDTDLYVSTILQDEYSLSDMVIHSDVPDDCVEMLLLSEMGR